MEVAIPVAARRRSGQRYRTYSQAIKDGRTVARVNLLVKTVAADAKPDADVFIAAFTGCVDLA